MATNRSSRSATTRDDETRRKPWTPPSMLDVPDAPPGYKYRWIRAEMIGQADKLNVSKRVREGYELVHPDEVEGFALPTIDDGKHAGVIGVGGLLLAKIPEETAGERKAYYEKQTQAQMTSIDAELQRESNPAMPIGAPNRSSHTTFGNPENKSSTDGSEETSS